MAKWGPILVGAAIGAGTAAVTGNDPLKGAVLGGVGGAIGGSDFSALGSTGKGVVAGKSGGLSLTKGTFSGVGPNSAAGSMVNNVTSSASSGLFGMSTGQVVSTALGGAGIFSSASAQAQQGLNTQAQANLSAQLAEQQATRSRQETEQINREFLDARGYDFGTRTSLLGRSGGNPERGSLLNVTSDYAGEVAYQSAKILNQGETTATRLQQQAALSRQAGRSAREAGFRRAGGTVLLGGSQLASNFFV